MEYTEVNVFDYWRVIKKRRWLITVITAVSLLISALITSTITEQYVASVSVLMPEGRRAAAGAGLAYLSQILSTSYNPAGDRPYAEILQSRMIAKKVAKILGRASYAGISVYKTGGRDIFTISCRHSDRKMAALMANAFAKALFEYEQEAGEKAIATRYNFVNQEFKKATENLKNAEESLIGFQKINKTLSVEREADIAINAIARLKYEVIDSEAEYENALKFYSPEHPDMIQLKTIIDSKKAKLAEEITKALSAEPEKGAADVGVGVMSNMLEKATQARKLQKMVEVHTAIYRFLLEEHEKLKLEMGKTVEPFEIIDPAVPPKEPSIPNVKLNIFLGFILGFVAGLSLSFFLEYLEALKKKEIYSGS